MSRQVRVETRSRHQNDLKRVMHSTEKVRKWEKKWVRIEETSLQIFKWMPITKNEEQQRQQLQEQISATVSAETLSTNTTEPHETNHSTPQLQQQNRENIQSRGAAHQMLDQNSPITLNSAPSMEMRHVPSLPAATGANTPRMNGSGGAGHKMNDQLSSSTVSPNTLAMHGGDGTNSNKRSHEGDSMTEREANESIHSPNSKRVKTTADMLSTPATSIRELVDNNCSTLASMHGANPVSAPVPAPLPVPTITPQPPSCLQQTAEAPLTIAQHHVQPSTTTPTLNTTSTILPDHNAHRLNAADVVGAKLIVPSGGDNMEADIEMMDTDEPQQQQQTPPTPPAVSNMTDALMEDFSSIVRNVTEQIVIKVSDCYGGDN